MFLSFPEQSNCSPRDFWTFFIQVGVPYPQVTFFLVAILEVGCGACIAGKFAVKQAAAALIVIMLGALYFAKLPALMDKGLLQFAFDARLDIVMLVILILLFRQAKTISFT
ncbi:DoxX family protein [Virgibacillus halophilus]|uniref:DoxX family protein n=1 Tax=Tigheibacillus halophilus TaxID=361280 RepID=A0ABU5C6K1_9BACI|nr:DoxX family protein [Virgibacillus halophilus]